MYWKVFKTDSGKGIVMEQNDGLLLDSDDSDIPDLDLPSAHIRKDRKKLFTKWVVAFIVYDFF